MEVIATKMGYHGKLRDPGDTFDVPEGSKATWFKPTGGVAIAAPKVGKAKSEPKAKAEPTEKADSLV